MDLLAQRYASPYLILDDFIRLRQLQEFIETIVTRIADEKTNDARWEYWLHKVYDMSFAEYVRKCEEPERNEQVDYAKIGGIINDSKKMLDGFIPDPPR